MDQQLSFSISDNEFLTEDNMLPTPIESPEPNMQLSIGPSAIMVSDFHQFQQQDWVQEGLIHPDAWVQQDAALWAQPSVVPVSGTALQIVNMESVAAGPSTSSSSSSSSSSSQQRSGPMSRHIEIPARPKPGRKPMPEEESTSRRRTQNRNSQRVYRDKRQQKVEELTTHNHNLHVQCQQLQAHINRQNDEHRRNSAPAAAAAAAAEARIQHLSEENVMLRSRVYELEQQLYAGIPSFSGPKLPAIGNQAVDKQEVAIPTPPEDKWNEIDMTDVWTRSKPAHQGNDWNGYDIDTDPTNGSGCGFCTDDGNCACKVPAPPKQTSTGPGTCDMCQQDPARAAACRSLADKTEPSTATALPEAKAMSCGQFIDKIQHDHGRMPSIIELFGPLHSFPARTGFNVDEQEAAKALQGLSAMGGGK